MDKSRKSKLGTCLIPNLAHRKHNQLGIYQMGHFGPGDQKSSWIAVFILVIYWLFTVIPRFYYSAIKQRDDGTAKVSRAYNAYDTARDGVLLLAASTALAFAAKSNVAATDTLSWLFFANWTVLLILCYVTESRILLNSLRTLGFLLIIANIIQALATAKSRYYYRLATYI